MAEGPRLAYLQARLQSRHGDRPSPEEWRMAESSADLSHYLEAIRRTALKRWVGDVNHEMAPEAIERLLRDKLASDRIVRLQDARAALAADPPEVLTRQEINEEISAYRKGQRLAAGS